MWSKIGVTLIAWKYPLRSHFCLFGGITLSGSQPFRIIGKYTAVNVVGVLNEMHKKRGQFGLVRDRASQHTAEVVSDFRVDHASDIRSRRRPAAGPNRNSVEGTGGIRNSTRSCTRSTTRSTNG